MNLLKFSKIVPVILLASAIVWATHAGSQNPAPTTFNRAYTLTFHVNAPSTIPNGAGVTCRAVITHHQSALQRFIGESAAVESSLGVAVIAGSSADCAVEVPSGASVAQLRDGATLSYRIDAFTPAGPSFVRTQAGVPVAPTRAALAPNLRMNVNL